jgi:hypothetical protein
MWCIGFELALFERQELICICICDSTGSEIRHGRHAPMLSLAPWRATDPRDGTKREEEERT